MKSINIHCQSYSPVSMCDFGMCLVYLIPLFVAFTEVAATPLAVLVFEGETIKGQGLDWGG